MACAAGGGQAAAREGHGGDATPRRGGAPASPPTRRHAAVAWTSSSVEATGDTRRRRRQPEACARAAGRADPPRTRCSCPLSVAQICSLLRGVCVLRFACCFAASACVRSIAFRGLFVSVSRGSWSSPRLLDCLLFLDLENLGISSFLSEGIRLKSYL